MAPQHNLIDTPSTYDADGVPTQLTAFSCRELEAVGAHLLADAQHHDALARVFDHNPAIGWALETTASDALHQRLTFIGERLARLIPDRADLIAWVLDPQTWEQAVHTAQARTAALSALTADVCDPLDNYEPEDFADYMPLVTVAS